MTRISKQIREKIRPRSEQIIGIATQLADDVAALSPIASTLPNDSTEIVDGQTSPLPFLNSDFHAYLDLANTLLTAFTSIEATVEAVKVRPLASILNAYSPHDEPVTDAVSALKNRIRPMAKHFQRLRYQFEQDVAILLDTSLLGGMADGDEIDEERGDDVPAITVSQAKAIVNWGAGLTSDTVITTERARAVNAASMEGLY
jgi:hypothetical protein